MSGVELIFLILLITSIFIAKSHNVPPVICTGAVGRCNGKLLCDSGEFFPDSAPIRSTSEPGVIDCANLCIDTPGCLNVVYISDLQNCTLYGSGKFVKGTQNTVCSWKCCRDIDSCRRSVGQCTGYWVQYPRSHFSGKWPLSNGYASTLISCLTKCQQHPLCGYANFGQNTSLSAGGDCQLFKFNPPHVDLTRNDSKAAYEWYCCPPDDKDINTTCRPGANKCFGRMLPRHADPKNYTRLVIFFYTRDKLDCLNACTANPYCTRAFYNQTFNFCVLKSNVSTFDQAYSCQQPKEVQIFQSYEWKCCNSRKSTNEKDNDDSSLPDCECFNGTVLVAANDCDHPDIEHQVIIKANFTAFWVRRGKSINKWQPLNNGYTNIWAKGHSKKCPKLNCRLFSTSIESTCPKIVNRSEWFARSPLHRLVRFPNSPIYFGIKDTVCPVFGCFTYASCSSIVRSYQFYHQYKFDYDDITYNFLIGSDGLVYEGRGSKFICGNINSFRAVTINIAFIGKFEVREPSIASLKAAKELILCLQRCDDVTKNFVVFPYSSLTSDPINPGKMLSNLITNWPHYARTRLKGKHCPQVLPLWYVLVVYAAGPFIALAIFTTILATLYVRIWSHAEWCPKRTKRIPRTTFRICELDDKERLIKCPRDLPPNCVLRDRFSWKVSPTSSSIVMLQSGTRCKCVNRLHLLWIKCCTYASDDFLKRVALSINTCRCKAFTLLLMGKDQPFILHGFCMTRLLILIDDIMSYTCVCHVGSNVTGKFGLIPTTEEVARTMAPVGWSSKWHGWMEGDVDEEDPRSFQRIFVWSKGVKLEVTYDLYNRMPQILGIGEREGDDALRMYENIDDEESRRLLPN